jgi:hypothetical protein
MATLKPLEIGYIAPFREKLQEDFTIEIGVPIESLKV